MCAARQLTRREKLCTPGHQTGSANRTNTRPRCDDCDLDVRFLCRVSRGGEGGAVSFENRNHASLAFIFTHLTLKLLQDLTGCFVAIVTFFSIVPGRASVGGYELWRESEEDDTDVSQLDI